VQNRNVETRGLDWADKKLGGISKQRNSILGGVSAVPFERSAPGEKGEKKEQAALVQGPISDGVSKAIPRSPFKLAENKR